MDKLRNAALMLKHWKDLEEQAKENRIAYEEEIESILSATLPLEGSKTFTVDDLLTVTVTRKLTRTLDYDAYQKLFLLPEESFVEMKPSIILSRVKEFERLAPAIVATCITTKPAKTAVTVKPIEAKES